MMSVFRNIFFAFLIITFVIACANDRVHKTTSESTLFTAINSNQSNIDFINLVNQDFSFNFLQYPYAFIGGGVAVGDINNDGLEDIYFTSNQQSNKLYLNKGNFEFEDITQTAGVADAVGWSTGVNMIDINNDGWMDIYVCKSASVQNNDLRKNILYINQKDGTFVNEADKWGLANDGFSIQSYFFDYDNDGDLDMFLVNHRHDFENTRILERNWNKEITPQISDHLFRNDNGTFTDVTIRALIKNKAWGLSASIGDYNNDGWLDIFVANDYITPDYLYINHKDGTFRNEINERFKHISYSSMGSDYVDINNDLLPDLMVLDMSAEDHKRSKENMATMSTNAFWLMADNGYHKQYMANMLHLNNGDGSYSDVGQLAGISKTDWSWAPLIADFDNDGLKDIFVTNGVERDMTNQDYIKAFDERQANRDSMTVNGILEMMPSVKLANYSYKNKGDLKFEKTTEAWGLDENINSNGVAYADFDNDGDLDLVLNNMADKASLYRNNSVGNYISIKLVGSKNNIDAIGAKIKVITDNNQQYQEHFSARGYQSSMTKILNFGLGEEDIINRIEVVWPDNSVLAMENVNANQTVVMDKKDFDFDFETKITSPKIFEAVDLKDLGIDYVHQENDFNDFNKQVLLPQKQSQKGPTLSVKDLNGDGLEDFFIGGALGHSGAMYLQKQEGSFAKVNNKLFSSDKRYEDNGSLFFDSDGDGDLDLYVASGGYELDENSTLLQDRLYINDGKGIFNKSTRLPNMINNTKSVVTIDFDDDGDNDLIVGGHVVPGKYPLAASSYILENNNGTFTDVTDKLAPELSNIGIINDIILSDYDGDNDRDLIVVGEWMPITIFENTGKNFIKKDLPDFENTSGWWNSIVEVDLDNDGDQDYLVGNLGGNNKFHPTVEAPLHIYGNNFDEDGLYDMLMSKSYQGSLVPLRGMECSSDQNSFVSEKIASFKEFASSSIIDIYGEEEIESSYHKEVYTFSSSHLINNGDGTFTIKDLPVTGQFGPTMAFNITDINNDGYMDVIGVGNIFEAEVETISYDASTGYLLLGDAQGNLNAQPNINIANGDNVKDLQKITISNVLHYIVASNDGPLSLYKVIE